VLAAAGAALGLAAALLARRDGDLASAR
jgi:hypothetical protein